MIEVLMQTEAPEGLAVEAILTRAAEGALAHEGAAGDIAICIVDDAQIHTANLAYRGVDRPTDVLSFPAGEGEALLAPPDGFLGDILISLPRALCQAADYGHTPERELSFLAVHGTLHLLGYDHINKDEAAAMFALQTVILDEMRIVR